ncbi:hypothetical protein J6590_011355 [Homalodisca vitripennis]|nr:hypothetical protein J6590_011355 [Homalodisca vitripennis]
MPTRQAPALTLSPDTPLFTCLHVTCLNDVTSNRELSERRFTGRFHTSWAGDEWTASDAERRVDAGTPHYVQDDRHNAITSFTTLRLSRNPAPLSYTVGRLYVICCLLLFALWSRGQHCRVQAGLCFRGISI